MSNNKDQTSIPAKQPSIGVLGIAIVPIAMFSISTAFIAHFHQFEYIHQLLPNFLLNYVSKENLPLAILGVNYFFTDKITGIANVAARALLSKEGYDNNHPRRNDHNATGLVARFNGAHMNAHEVFPGFAAAVLSAYIANVPTDKIVFLATTNTLIRFLHFGFYIANLALPRSIIYNIGTYTTIYLFLFATVTNFDATFQTLCKTFFATPF
ncbi:hypothetical protein K502DRAFT_365567 [Neoconidiobolus thromboides FSU 785]|nr:hypothetical protein K502DRAFT_365567 [Neoconidiobolus thromboides FSU 785]